MPRLFVGVFIPDSVKKSILDFQSSLSNLPMEAKNVEDRKLHLTLSFLGNVSSEKIEELESLLKDVASRHSRFSVKLGNGLVIPDEDHIRVIALGASSNASFLENLRKDVHETVGGDSMPVHLTLSRVRKISDRKHVADFVKDSKVEEYFDVDSFVLVKSTLGGRGPKYETVSSFSLGSR